MSEQVDRLGTVASSICAAHCAICALLPVALSSTGLGFLLGHEVEWAFTLIAVAFAVGALALGWRQHRSVRVAALLSFGVVALLASRGIEMSMGHDDHDDHHGHAAEVQQVHHQAHGSQSETHEEHHSPGEAATMEDVAARGKDHGHHEHSSEHGDAEHGSTEIVHLAGAGVGVFGGFLLLCGHLLNIQSSRRSREDCCP